MDIKLFYLIFVFFSITVVFFLFKETRKEILLAACIALVWTYFYPYEYVGGGNFYLFGAINLFPLVLQTAGLIFLAETYKRIRGGMWLRFLFVILIYWFFLWAVEAFGYHVLEIRTISGEPSFLGLGVLHIPLYAQLYYVFIGPVYLLVIEFLKIDR